MAVTYQTEGVKMPDIKKRETTEWIKAVAASYGKRLGEIAYIFCSDEKILEVNRQYLQHDYYTDIITFDYCEGDRLSGDLFISLDTVRTNAEQFGASYDNELHRVIIHGILHLCGINDKGPGEREIMEAAENKADNFGGFFVNQPEILVAGVFDISVWGFGCDWLSACAFCADTRFYFLVTQLVPLHTLLLYRFLPICIPLVDRRADERLCPCPAKCLYDGRGKKDSRADAMCGPRGDLS